jgi:uncharacterized lipoprotein YehR (DUF1307 family)
MANSKLINKNIYYKIPQYIIDEISIKLIKYKTIKSKIKQKGKNIIKNKFLSYQNLKRIKNFFDTINDIDFDLNKNERQIQIRQNKIDFSILGGNRMKSWVNNQLNSLRQPIHRSKKIKSNFADMDNQFRKPHDKTFNKAPKVDMVSDIRKGVKIDKMI